MWEGFLPNGAPEAHNREMAQSARRALGACVSVLALVLVTAPCVSADPNVIPIAGGASSGLGDGGSALDATLTSPQQVAVLHDYDFYYRDYLIADYDHCRVRQVAYND